MNFVKRYDLCSLELEYVIGSRHPFSCWSIIDEVSMIADLLFEPDRYYLETFCAHQIVSLSCLLLAKASQCFGKSNT